MPELRSSAVEVSGRGADAASKRRLAHCGAATATRGEVPFRFARSAPPQMDPGRDGHAVLGLP